MQIAPLPETGADWARHRRKSYASGAKTTGQNTDKLGQAKPEWLTAAWGVSDRIERASLPPWSPYEEDKLWSAIACIPADDRGTWIPYGAAIHDLQWESGFAIFHRWSMTSKDKYKGEEDCARTWVSFDRPYNGIPATLASIYADARARGWVEPSVNDSNFNGMEAIADVLPPQITEEINEKPLIMLNKKHAVINNLGNKPVVLDFVESPIKGVGQIPVFVTFKSFEDRYCNQYITLKKEKTKRDGTPETVDEQKELGRYWLHWGKRRTYEGIGLAPTGDLPPHYFNLWNGFAVEPRPGNWRRMQEHLYTVIANNDENHARYIMNWCAWAVQIPGECAGAALVLRGGKGTGKGTFANAIQALFGTHGLHIHNSKHLVGHFNAILRNCLLLFADEAFWAGDKQGESTLKGLLTDPTLVIEHKGIDPIPWPNRLHVIMAANSEWVVPAGPAERRFAVFDVSDNRIQNWAYFTALRHEIANGGMEAMLYDLQHHDLDGWHPARTVPQNAALSEQKALTMDWRWQWWENLLQDGMLPYTGEPNMVSAVMILENAQKYLREGFNRVNPPASPQTIGRFLRKLNCELHHTMNGNIWFFPELATARNNWIKIWGHWKWDLDISKWHKREIPSKNEGKHPSFE